MNDSPISDFSIEFTRLNRTDGSALSSLSSLNIPSASNTSLTITNNSTPSRRTSIATQRMCNTTPRRSGHMTPTDILRMRQSEKLKIANKRDLRLRKTSLRNFDPPSCSTPVHLERKRSSVFQALGRNLPGDATPVVNSTNDNAHDEIIEQDKNVNTSISKNRSERTLTNESNKSNKCTETGSDTMIPETQENDSVIPETQDDRIPNTQDDYIPETQEDNVPATQDEVATDPVQAQVYLAMIAHKDTQICGVLVFDCVHFFLP